MFPGQRIKKMSTSKCGENFPTMIENVGKKNLITKCTICGAKLLLKNDC